MPNQVTKKPTKKQKKRNQKGVSSVALKINKVQQANTEENKSWDILPISQVLSNGSGIVVLNTVPAGSDIFNRTGRKINLVSIQIRGTVTNTSAVSSANRILLIYDRQFNGASPALADVLRSENSTGNSSTAIDFINLQNRNRFHVLKDIHWPSYGVVSEADPLQENTYSHINWFVDLRGLTTIFTNVGGTASSAIQTGALFLFFVSTLATGPTFNFSARLRYKDA